MVAKAGDKGLVTAWSFARTATSWGFKAAGAALRASAEGIEKAAGNKNPFSEALRSTESELTKAEEIATNSALEAEEMTRDLVSQAAAGMSSAVAAAGEGQLLQATIGEEAAEAVNIILETVKRFAEPLKKVPPHRVLLATRAWHGAQRCARQQMVKENAGKNCFDITDEMVRWMLFTAAVYGPGILAASGASIGHLIKANEVAAAGGSPGQQALASAGLDIEQVEILDFEEHPEDVFVPGFMVAVDYKTECVVVALRGTSNLKDVLADLVCVPDELILGGQRGTAHGGMLKAAQRLSTSLADLAEKGFEKLQAGPPYPLVPLAGKPSADASTGSISDLTRRLSSVTLSGSSLSKLLQGTQFSSDSVASVELCTQKDKATQQEACDLDRETGRTSRDRAIDSKTPDPPVGTTLATDLPTCKTRQEGRDTELSSTAKEEAGVEVTESSSLTPEAVHTQQPHQAGTPLSCSSQEPRQGPPARRLVVCGHSLGAGVSSLLTALWLDVGRFPDTKLECYAFACPQILDRELALAQAVHTTSFVCGDDMVPRLSLATVEDLRDALLRLHAPADYGLGQGLAAWELMKLDFTGGSGANMPILAAAHQLIREGGARSQHGRLFPAGRIVLLPGKPSDGKAWIGEHEDVDELVICHDMGLAHTPTRYVRSVRGQA